MNYKTIQKNIYNKRKLSFLKRKDYSYLVDNGIVNSAFNLLTDHKALDKCVIEKCRSVRIIFNKTLYFLDNLCKKHDIEYIIVKTLKVTNEIPDGDIDVVVKREQLKKLISLLKINRFRCVKEGENKFVCESKTYVKIEPRIDLSIHGKIIINESDIWKYRYFRKIQGKYFPSFDKEMDYLFLVLNTLYGPNYYKFYHFLMFHELEENKVLDYAQEIGVLPELNLVSTLSKKSKLNKKYPLFLDNISYFKWWVKRVWVERDISLTWKLRIVIFFLFIKYYWTIFGKLYFQKRWLE